MRIISDDLRNEIMKGRIANCLKFDLKNGNVFGYTDHDKVLVVDGVTYNPAPGLQKVKFNLTANAQVSNQEFGSAWVDAPETDLRGGMFDSATIEVAWVGWKHPEFGKLVTFTGQLGEISWSEEGFRADIVSFMKNLSKNVGTVFTAACRHTLFDTVGPGKVGGCNLDAAAYTFAGSVTAILTPKWRFNIAPHGKPDGYFSNGSITFTSGLNNGLSAIVKRQLGTEIDLFLPTAFVIEPGATFTVKAGCNKSLDTCKTKFSNVINFGGFPHIQSDVNFR